MQDHKIPCYYYPTTVVFIDDNQAFLDNLLLELDENITPDAFTNPNQAINYLKQNHMAVNMAKHLSSLKSNNAFEDLRFSNIENSYIQINLFGIHQEIYNQERFRKIIVVVIDYTMPQLTGLEICQALKGMPFKFILLTGDATVNKAIEAFNAGLIHKFIQKNHENLVQHLELMISDLQQEMFIELSEPLLLGLKTKEASYLFDQAVVEFLSKFFKENKIAEYYMVNDSGCFLTLTAVGDLFWLIIQEKAEVEEIISFALDNYAAEEITKELVSHNKILFLFTEKEHTNIAVDKWGKHLYPAKRLEGNNSEYYFSYSKVNPSQKDIFMDKITSYARFLTDKTNFF